MKRTGNKNLKIVAATSMAIFSLLTTFSAAFAWFTAMRKTGEETSNFKIDTVDGVLESITFHTLADTNGVTKTTVNGVLTPSKFSFKQSYIGKITYQWKSDNQTIDFTQSGQTSIDLKQYTPLDQEQPLLLMINLREEKQFNAKELKIGASASVDGYLGDRINYAPTYRLNGNAYNASENANPMIREKDNSVAYFPLSSVVKFYYSELAATNTTSGEKSIDDVKNGSSTYDFDLLGNDVDLEGGQNFVDFIDVTDDDYDIDFEQDITIYSSSNRHIKHVALVIDYFPEAIEYIYQTFLGDDTLDNTFEGILHFICDWTMEII